MGEVRALHPKEPIEPELVRRTGDSLHELVELGLLAYTGDGSDRFVITERLLRLIQPMLSTLELAARDIDHEYADYEYDADAWGEVRTEIGVLNELWGSDTDG